MTTSPAPAAAIAQLRSDFEGRSIGPDDVDYDKARTVVAGHIDRRPALIVRPTDASEVARVVAFARETGLPLAVRCGGHSGAGHSVVDDGIVLDLGNLTALEIDAEGRTA
ncbi:MAG: FAD-binding oxidoreductase, partial [Nocardioidaceae bacterium]